MSTSRFVSIASAVLVLASCDGGPIEPKVDPTFSVSASDTFAVQTSKDGQRVTFTVSVKGVNASETTWTVNGQLQSYKGARFEPVLQAGTYEVCGHNAGMRDCEIIQIKMLDLIIMWLVSRYIGGEFLPTGTVVTLIAGGQEKQVAVEAGSYTVPADFIATADRLEVCTQADVIPRCWGVEREEFFSPVYHHSYASRWIVQRGSHAGAVEDISVALGYEKTGFDNVGDPVSFYMDFLWYLPFGSVPPVKILASTLSAEDVVRVTRDISAAYTRLGWGQPVLLAESDSREACRTLIIRGTTDGVTSGAPIGCGLGSKSVPYEITGGGIALRVPNGYGACSVEHELWHVLGFHHHNSWPSIQGGENYCGSGNNTATSLDMAMYELWVTTLTILKKYPQIGVRNALMPWAADWYM